MVLLTGPLRPARTPPWPHKSASAMIDWTRPWVVSVSLEISATVCCLESQSRRICYALRADRLIAEVWFAVPRKVG